MLKIAIKLRMNRAYPGRNHTKIFVCLVAGLKKEPLMNYASQTSHPSVFFSLKTSWPRLISKIQQK